ncbi:MAG: TolC family protein [Acidobacteria bacterium]|nr:TolC family protein [Acidobacteriota bacterium]
MKWFKPGSKNPTGSMSLAGWLVVWLVCDGWWVPVGAQQTPIPPASAPQPSLVLLRDLVADSLEHNPEIQSMARNFDRMRARVPQAKALPEPIVTYSYAGNINPLPSFDLQSEDPASARMLNFSQEFPFPGKLDLKAKMASVEADTEWWKYEQTRLNLTAEVKSAYIEWWYLYKSTEIITKNKDLLEKFTRISEARYSVGKGIQQDVFKAQVEIAKLIDQLAILEQRRLTVEATLNQLRFRDPEAELGLPAELQPPMLTLTLVQMKDLALANYPEFKAQKRRIDRERYGFQLAQKEFYPDFSIGFIYYHRPKLPEMYGISLGLKLPLYFWRKQRPALAEAAAATAMEQKRLETLSSLVFFKLKEQHLAVTTARKLTTLYGTTIIPQSTLSLESAIAGYEVGKVDFLTLLDGLLTLQTYQLNYYEQVANQAKALAALEPLLGVELIR